MEASITEKLCAGCGITKPISEFYFSKRAADKLFSVCKKCSSTLSKEWYKKNRERKLRCARDEYAKNPQYFRDKGKKWKDAHPEALIAQYEKRKIDRNKFPDKYRDIKLRSKYGISLDEYNNMLAKQHNKCICGREFISYPHVDHDHKTGKVRGLLCAKCNHTLGLVEDNIEIMTTLIEYLKS